jgi:hypothetical protein
VLGTLLVVTVAGRAHALDIDRCGTSIPGGVRGTLTVDLVCTDAAPAITLEGGANLELAGHRLQGISADGERPLAVVECREGTCGIFGPGEIVGSDGIGAYGACIAGPPGGKLKIRSLEPGTVEIHDCSDGILAAAAKLRDVEVHRCVVGASAGYLKLLNTRARANVVGFRGQRILGDDVLAQDNSRFGVIGTGGGKIRLQHAQITGNGDAGVIGYDVGLSDSTVIRNNGYAQGVDIATFLVPRLRNVACDKSARTSQPYAQAPPAIEGTWPVCPAD